MKNRSIETHFKLDLLVLSSDLVNLLTKGDTLCNGQHHQQLKCVSVLK